MLLPLVVVDTRLGPLDFTDARMVPTEEVPEPFNRLLVHTFHMTVTVEEFYGEAVNVQVVSSQSEGDLYLRKILLTLSKSKRVIQFGLVRIDLTCLDPAVRDAILEEKTPLGRVLIEHNVLRRVQPTAFVTVRPKETMKKWFGMSEATPLHGRTGVIFCNDRPAIAVMEILAPVHH
ncbi:hypothetical protein KIH39_13515 [Telmatocola sphagniphila]|uniref:Uncharacterized protein n=1 Tax=Telmatocola sphagniphila TaxID=1123043 RepID=A0A8E6EVW3_9BACT|nr:hypothetical protein [Telmatocola sphagniphila]QVL29888.1 hypothetical protein KIH39_13515 [Telmatocola sphagniphila]